MAERTSMSKVKELSLTLDNGITVTTQRKEGESSNAESVSMHFSGVSDVTLHHEIASLEHLISFLLSSNF